MKHLGPWAVTITLLLFLSAPPVHGAPLEKGRVAYVANEHSGTISIIDGEAMQVAGTIAVSPGLPS